jgi:signal transduction histidine kinase
VRLLAEVNMATVGTLQAGLAKQRVRTRVLAYGVAAGTLAIAALLGYLTQPLLPLAVAVGGLLFARNALRLRSLAFAVSVAFDVLAVITLAIITQSPLLGVLAIGVATLISSIGKSGRTVARIGAFSGLVLVVLVLIEQTSVLASLDLPQLAAPARLVVTLVMATVIASAGAIGVSRLLTFNERMGIRAVHAAEDWRGFVQQSEHPILMTANGLVTHANRAAIQLTGRSQELLYGVALSSLLEDGRKLTRPDGSVAIVDALEAPLAFEDDTTRVVFLTDITEQKLREQNLADSVASTDRFVASVSHEVRTPLSAVVGLSHVLDEQWDHMSDEEIREIIRLIAAQSNDVSRIVEDLLVAARSGSAGIQVHRERVELRDEVTQVLATISEEAHQVSVNNGPPGIAVADAGRVRQIVRNLITNAVRYGGPEIVVDVREDGDFVAIEVSDDGDPIPENDRDRIFQPFARAGGSIHPDSIGLGLSASRQLAELMGGTLTYMHSGGRSRFSLSVPRRFE